MAQMWMIDDGKPLYGDDDGKTLKWVCVCEFLVSV